MELLGVFLVFLLFGLTVTGGGDEEDTDEPVTTLYDDFDGNDPQPDDGTIAGTLGNDLIFGGLLADGEQDTIDSGVQDDTIEGFAGDDTIFGGVGSDSLLGGQDNDLINTGAGTDLADGGPGNDTITSADDAGSFDLLIGGEDDDLIVAGPGGGIAQGDEGNDTILGGTGDLQADGGTGDDSILGGSGGLAAVISQGDDTLVGNSPDDRALVIGSETLAVNADLRNGTVTGLGGTTQLSGFERFGGAQGDDTIQGDDDGNILLAGQLGNDIITGGDGEDWLVGEEGDDTLDGGAGADTIDTGSGSDVIVAGEDDLITDFDPTLDFIDLTGTYSVLEDARADLSGAGVLGTLNLTIETGPSTPILPSELTTANTGLPTIFNAAGRIFDDFDGTTAQADDGSIIGTAGGDVIYGGLLADGEQDTVDSGVANDSIAAGDGSDTVFGGPGADTIEGGDDADSVNGGTGFDNIFGGDGDDTLVAGDDDPTPNRLFGEGGNDLLISTNNGFDTLNGGSDDDTLIASGADAQIEPGPGNDSVVASADFNTVLISRGDDTIDGTGGEALLAENLSDTTDRLVDLPNGIVTALAAGFGTQTVSGIDQVVTHSGNDTILGDDDGNALLSGGLGDDSIIGGAGVDVLDGASDNDFLDGGGGADRITTGLGADTIVAGADDTITDFDPALDFIDLTGTYTTLSEARADLNLGVLQALNLTINVNLGGAVSAGELTTANTGLPDALN